MSLDLIDLRAKISPDTASALAAIAKSRDKDVSALVREVVEAWVLKQLTMAAELLAEAQKTTHTRRAYRKPISPVRRAAIYHRDGGVCAYCKAALDRDGNWHLDHVVPRVRGGSDADDNLKLACPACNLSKAARVVGSLAS